MGANKKWNDIGDILLRVMCTDDDAFKTAVYRHNAGCQRGGNQTA